MSIERRRVCRVTLDGKTLELAGELFATGTSGSGRRISPGRADGVRGVVTLGENGAETAIDLSWQPDPEADMAGYIVYRREGGGAWERISPAEPVVGPAFHDAHVQPGHTYTTL